MPFGTSYANVFIAFGEHSLSSFGQSLRRNKQTAFVSLTWVQCGLIDRLVRVRRRIIGLRSRVALIIGAGWWKYWSQVGFTAGGLFGVVVGVPINQCWTMVVAGETMVGVPRPELPLDPDDGLLARFAADLRRLRETAGRPGYRQLARRAHYAAATLSEAAAGRKLPTLAVTLAYVTACGGDHAEWEARWHATAAELAQTRADDTDATVEHALAPYKGLAAFQVTDAEWFFGRDRLIGDLLVQLRERRCLAVFGASGSGKSSLLRAGVVPRFGHGPCMVFTPGAHPLEECAARLARFTGHSPQQWCAEMTAYPRALHLAVLQILADHPDDAEMLIVVDQFEEVFTLCDDQHERSSFIHALLTAAETTNSRVRVILGIRADFYARCTDYPRLVDILNDAQVLVGAMTTEELRQAIVQPATKAGCAVEGALLASLIADAADHTGVLPLVSHTLLETWKRRRGTMLTLTAYQATGGIRGSLAQTAEGLYSALTADQQRLAKSLLLRLVALGEHTYDTKRRVPRDELDLNDPHSDTVLDQLTRARLLTVDQDTVEIAHEALIRAWPRLQRWLSTDREGLHTHRQLSDAAQSWLSLGRDPGALYRGARLAVAREWATAGPPP